jgi:basic membrane protein A
MIKKRLQLLTGVLLALALLTAGCSGDSDEPSVAEEAGPARIALVMSGSINDGGWNQGAYEGLDALTTQGFDTSFTEDVAQADIPSTVEGYALDGYDLVIGHGFEFGTTVSELAPEYPDTHFFATTFIPDPDVPLSSNLTFVDAQYYTISYAAGALAALQSESGVVGIVGGGDNPTQQTMLLAFKAGATETVSGAEALDVLTGSYDDPQLGREAATAMIGQGADVILHIADTTGLGAIEGATEQGVEVIGFYQDQTQTAPDLMLTSFRMELADMVEFLGQNVGGADYPAGTEWAPSTEFMWTFTYGGDDYNADLVSSDVWGQFESVFEEVNSGAISVPTH